MSIPYYATTQKVKHPTEGLELSVSEVSGTVAGLMHRVRVLDIDLHCGASIAVSKRKT